VCGWVSTSDAIELGLARGEWYGTLARRFGRPTSTVATEVKRGGGRDCYQAVAAQRVSEVRARRPKVLKLVTNPTLGRLVSEGLAKRSSPGEVAARLELSSRSGVRVGEPRDHLLLAVPVGQGRVERTCLLPCDLAGCGAVPGRWVRGQARQRPRRHRAHLGPPPEAADQAFPGH